jgi:molecular chaperone DnaK (HSP70)
MQEAIKDGGRVAGLNMLHLTSDPIAAALAYGLDRCRHHELFYHEEQNIVVLDMESHGIGKRYTVRGLI